MSSIPLSFHLLTLYPSLQETNPISLKDFTNLKTLETYPGAFLGPDDSDVEQLILNLPPNLENLIIEGGKHHRMSEAICYLFENTSSFTSLKTLDLGWRMVSYPDSPTPRLADVVPGIQHYEAVHIVERCEELGLEMVFKKCKPPYKVFYDWYDKSLEVEGQELGQHERMYRPQYLEYPYAEWDDICVEFDVNPDTGRRWHSVYPLKEVVWHYAPDREF